MYTFEPKLSPDWKPYVGDPFDISLDPVRMTQMATGALMFLRGDVLRAQQTVNRTYSEEQVFESRRLPSTEQPYFTPGFPLELPLEHAVRIQAFNGPPTESLKATGANPIVSDTRELSWFASAEKTGLVTVDTGRTQALVGFIKANRKATKNLSVDITNNFAAMVLSSIDGKPLAQSDKMLLTAGSRVANTGMKWNDAHTRLIDQGGSPSLIEPVAGTVTLRNLEKAQTVTVSALDGAGNPIGDAVQARKTASGWAFPIGDTISTWYIVTVHRR